jgi:4-hydroxy-tetrahydrodipicolinate reductase
MARIAIAGVGGRMGRAILNLALKDKSLKVAGAFEKEGNSVIGTDLGLLVGSEPLGVKAGKNAAEAIGKADALIDFTHPTAMEGHLQAALETKTAYVVGTTGLTDKHIALLKAASRKIPVVQSPNMSIGVNLLFKIAEITAKALDEDYDIEIVEAHHRLKKDSPSGTALKLLEIVAQARGKNIKKDTVYGREGETGARPRGEIGVFAVRGGDVVGDHNVSFLAEGERVELVHRATSRDAFAQGALKAAKFAAARKSGFFNMLQVLGIE